MKTVRNAVVSAIVAAFAMFATPQIASAQSAMTEITPASVDLLVSPNASTLTHLVVAMCDSTTQDCLDFQQHMKLTAALSKGGWLTGVPGMTTNEFYFIDTNTNSKTVGALSNLCARSGAPAGPDICSQMSAIQSAKTPFLIMMNLKTGAMLTAPGDIDELQVRWDITDFLKH